MDLSAPICNVPGIGPARARRFSDAGFRTVEDLLDHLPSRYEDRRDISSVAEARLGVSCTYRGHLSEVRRIRTRRRGFSIVQGILKDASGALPVVWFNRPYLTRESLEGKAWLLHGQVREGRAGLELLNPSVEHPEQAVHGARIAPIYPAVAGLGPAFLRRILDRVLAEIDLPRQVREPLPAELLARHGLPKLGEALQALHAPHGNVEELNERRSPAQQRLIYQELLDLQLGLDRKSVV